MRAVRTMSAGVALVVACVGIAYATLGPDRLWRLFGDPDLGTVSFETLRRRATPNDALACPPGLCTAPSDVAPPLFGMSARELRAAFARMIAAEPRVVRVASDDETLTDRYIQHSRWLGFPDTVVVRFLDRAGGTSTLALYSRSKYGIGDLGVNLARIERWLAGLAAIAKPVAPNASDLLHPSTQPMPG